MSCTFPTFANPDAVHVVASVDKEPRGESDAEGPIEEKDDEEPVKWEDEASAEGPSDVDRADSLRWVDSKVHGDEDGTGSVLSLSDGFRLRLRTRMPQSFPGRRHSGQYRSLRLRCCA